MIRGLGNLIDENWDYLIWRLQEDLITVFKYPNAGIKKKL